MQKLIDDRMKDSFDYVRLMIITLFSIVVFMSSITVAQESEKIKDFSASGGIQTKKESTQTKKGATYFGGSVNKSSQPDPYLIGPEDVLNISVWKNEDLNHEVIVRPDGQISFPLIGDIKAGGKTPEELRLEITKRLDRFIPDPVVTVMVLDINSIKIYVIGNVPRPGEFIVGERINVLQALSKAGGLNDFASSKNIIIIRTIDRKQIKIPFNYKDITKGKDTEQNIYLQSGDVIVVP